MIILWFIIAMAIYFVPSFMASGKRDSGAIIFLNLLFGWTVIGWIVCFVWACISPANAAGAGQPENLEAAHLGFRAALDAWPVGVNEVSVHGESMNNLDGTSRQRIIAGLMVGDAVTLVREPQNRYDPNAIRVDASGGTIGYVAANEAVTLHRLMDAGRVGAAVVKDILGGTADRPTRGVWLKVMILDPAPVEDRSAPVPKQDSHVFAFLLGLVGLIALLALAQSL